VTLTINCPKCGRTLASIDSDGEIDILKCLVHGVFHIGPEIDLTPGLPTPTPESSGGT
jgi:hypothetical protein